MLWEEEEQLKPLGLTEIFTRSISAFDHARQGPGAGGRAPCPCPEPPLQAHLLEHFQALLVFF